MEEKLTRSCVCFLGSFGSGKSTTIGHLITKKSKKSSGKPYGCIERDPEEMNFPKNKYVEIVDHLKTERWRGMSTNLNFQHSIECNTKHITIISTPGHPTYFGNLIKGMSLADASVLLVSSNAATFKETKKITKTHIIIARAMGVKEIIVAVNKMDECGFCEENFRKIEQKMQKMLSEKGFRRLKTQILPISGLMGHNLVEKSKEMNWFEGKSLYDAMKSINIPSRLLDQPFRMAVMDSYRIGGVGTVIVGKIVSGRVQPGAVIVKSPWKDHMPSNTTVHDIEYHHQRIKTAKAGDLVGINIRHINPSDVKRGDVLGEQTNPPESCTSFTARLLILDSPKKGIKAGFSTILNCHTASVVCQWTTFISKKSSKGKQEVESPSCLFSGDTALVALTPENPVCLEPFKLFPDLGRVFIRDHNTLVAIGVVEQTFTTKPAGSGRLTKGIL